MVRRSTSARSTRFVTITTIIDEFQVNIMILGFSTDTKAPSLDTRKDDTNKLSK